jgi:hypothetical protein
VLFALASPTVLVALLAAFLLALAVRTLAQRLLAKRLLTSRSSNGHGWAPSAARTTWQGEPLLSPRRDIDVFGAVAALFAGTGWGRRALLEDAGGADLQRQRGRRLAVALAGPVAPILTGFAVLAAWQALGGNTFLLQLNFVADLLRGQALSASTMDVVLLSAGAELIGFGVLALVPLPPLDGWEVVRLFVLKQGPGFQKARHWLEDNNIGVAILLGASIFPFGLPITLFVVSAISTPLLQLWV